MCEEKTFHLYSADGKNKNSHIVLKSKSSQDFLYCMYAKQKGYINIHIRTPDSDIFFICFYYAKTELLSLNVFIDTGHCNN